MSKKAKIILALVIGFAAAMILMSVFIYFGYSSAYSTDAEQYTVKILGISIYELTRSGDKYIGSPVGPNMGIICGICMAVSFAAEEIIYKIRRK